MVRPSPITLSRILSMSSCAVGEEGGVAGEGILHFPYEIYQCMASGLFLANAAMAEFSKEISH
jgi:hypothetical protein